MGFNPIHMTPLVSGSGGPPPFNPLTDIPGLNVWLNGSPTVGAGAYILSGNNILAWGNGATSGVPYLLNAASPQFATNLQNGLSGTVFDNSATLQQLYSAAPALYSSTGGFYMDCVLETLTEINVPLFFAVNNEINTQYTGFAVSSNPAYSDILLGFDPGTSAGFKAATPNGFATDILGKAIRLTFTYDGSGLSTSNPGGFKIYLNGVSLPLTSPAGVGVQYNSSSTIGGWGGGGNRFDGNLLELFFANQAPSGGLLTTVGTYYTNRWAI